MPTGERWLLTDDDRARLNTAISAAEKGTAGELVVVLADRSDPYPEIGGKVGLLAVLATQLIVFSLPGLDPYYPMLIPLATALAFGFGWWASPLLPDELERRLVGRDVLEEEVREKALAVFHQRKLGTTRERTGCLIYVSLFEQVTVVFGDVGISEKVPQERWGTICDEISRGLGAGRPIDAIERGIGACGALLSAHVPPAPDDVNEIPDEVVVLSA
ncbi:MAG: hypothetical protein HZA54_10700 [Planctomycetes bacterium]|nr:hypothetical protein [Planctomycetota bacterium]